MPAGRQAFAEDALADLVNIAATGEARAAEVPPRWAPDVRAARIDDGALRRGGLRFYEAPVGFLCTIDRNATREQWLDHGCFVNNIILASNAFAMSACVIGDFQGLEACIEPSFAMASDEEITIGIGIGDADRARERITERRPLEVFSEFHWQ
jgi:nitroreductase